MALSALAIASLGGISAAQAATGGASSHTAPAPTAPGEGGIAFSTPLRYAGASWYGPGLYGNHTACGQTLRPSTVGVAHKTLPCGTLVKFVFHGRTVIAPVIDRGPYIRGRAWDLTTAASKALNFESVGVGRVAYAIELGAAGP
ncbi:MAG: septal ring lytic transglycosylase RlpA family protein [Solirubrobacterales bacterium]